MMLADLLRELGVLPDTLDTSAGVLCARGHLPTVSGPQTVQFLGIVDRTALGLEEALFLSGRILDSIDGGDQIPIVLLLDCGSQRMRRREELLGLNEYLAHLAKSLMLAERAGHRTLGVLYGHAAAGAFIVTGLATSLLVALPGATPQVMDLRAMARVTKLPLELLEAKSHTTPVFAPGLENLSRTGAVYATCETGLSLVSAIAALLAQPPALDARDRWGAERGGRLKAAEIAARVIASLRDE